jgi:hypothetical protein
MSGNQINLSLDEIIKTNKNKKSVGAAVGSKNGIVARRRQANLARRQKFQQKVVAAVATTARPRRSRLPVASTAAVRRGFKQQRGTTRLRTVGTKSLVTQKLVQNLFRKAINQRRLPVRKYQRPALSVAVRQRPVRIGGQRGRLNRVRLLVKQLLFRCCRCHGVRSVKSYAARRTNESARLTKRVCSIVTSRLSPSPRSERQASA